ncbi:acyltransferase domain-containing protein, partial [Streptosporangium carneum]|uniref:acyltransferase domain-containing protein n=1 Tax=Streptosporangium carneum TaxID=47481 RepID=UPI0022F2F89D
HLDQHPDLDPADVAHSLATTRAVFEHRAVVLGHTRQELTDGVRALASNRLGSGVTTGAVSGTRDVAFLFTGQGSQRPGMGHDLYHAFPAYAQTVDRLTTLFDHHLTELGHPTPTPTPTPSPALTPLRDLLLTPAHHTATDPALIHRTLYTQPALFTLQVALHHLLHSWNIHPTAVAGH